MMSSPGQLYLIAGRRDGIIANEFADELIDLCKVNLTQDGAPTSCPLTLASSRARSGLMGDFARVAPVYTGSFSAAAGVYVSPRSWCAWRRATRTESGCEAT